MKEWWNNLILREKQMVSLGALIIGAALIYLVLWSPLDNHVSQLRSQILNNQELLLWMKKTDKRIEVLEKKPENSVFKPSSGSLLAIVQKQIKTSSVAKALDQLHQADNNSVQLTFKKVNFDTLMTWIITLTKQQGLIVTQMTVTPSATTGIVATDFTLSSSSQKS
jgi:general secretion pathway protein M